MARNSLADLFRIRELRDRLVYTFVWLVIFRIGVYLPIPGIDASALATYFGSRNAGSGVTDYLDFFAGGAFKNFSVFMLTVGPFISTQIVMQLLLIVFPKLKQIAEEDGGRKKIARWTRIGTIFVSIAQSLAVIAYAKSIPGAMIISEGLFTVVSILTVTTGSLFLVWIGEQITKRGIGNGVSLIIFAGIVSRLPHAIYALVLKIQSGELNPVYAIVVLTMFILVIALVVMEQQGQRKIPVNYAKRVVGRKMYGGANTYIPFKVNPSGVIPIIFASSLLTFPLSFAQMMGPNVKFLRDFAAWLRPAGLPYNIVYIGMIIFFAYFYTQVSLNPQEISKQIRENGGSIPGIRSDKMEEYLTKILNRILLPGSLYLALIALIPTLIQAAFQWV